MLCPVLLPVLVRLALLPAAAPPGPPENWAGKQVMTRDDGMLKLARARTPSI